MVESVDVILKAGREGWSGFGFRFGFGVRVIEL